MDSHSKITQRHPSTGANPSEQTAENAQKGQQSNHMWRMDEMLYKLVENNVAYAGEQFGENLRFNSEVLTNVLYDNIRKLVGDNFEGEDFANWIADELLKNGYILKSSEPSRETPDKEVKEEIVYAIDEKDYQDLLDRINATLVLLGTNREQIRKRLLDVDGQVVGLGNQIDTISELKQVRDKQISALVERIQTNHDNIQTYIESHDTVKREFAEKVFGLHKKVDEFSEQQSIRQIQDGKLAIKTKDILDRVGKNWKSQEKQNEKLKDQLTELGKKQISPKKSPNAEETPKKASPQQVSNLKPTQPSKKTYGKISKFKPITTKLPQPTQSDNGGGGKPKGKIGSSMLSGKDKKQKKDIFGQTNKPKKLSIGQRIKKKIGEKAKRIKSRISNSIIGKTYRAVAKVVKFVVKAVVLVAKAVKKTIVAAWKATKFVAKTFYKAAKLTGKAVKAVGKGAINLGKRFVKFAKKVGVKGVAMAALTSSGAKIVTKLGWKAIKFIGKSIWKGIKKLAFKALSFFGALFGIMGKFVNKVGHWVGILAHGIADKSYRFIIKPLATMMVSIFNFVTGIVLSPIQFIKWLIPTIIDKIMDVLSNIAQAVKGVLKSTWGVFKRILKNPITIALLIGGLFFLLWKWLGPKLSGGIDGIKKTLIPMIKSFASKALSFVTSVGKILFTIGKFIFKAIDWLTKPSGPIAKFITTVVKTFLAIKGWIKKMIKASGKDGLDALCMFLSGDYIGMALSVASAYAIKAWDYLKNTTLIRFVRQLIKSLVAFGKLIFSASTVIIRSLGAGLTKLLKGDFGAVAGAIVKPWKDLWNQVKNIGKVFDISSRLDNMSLDYDPTDELADKTTTESSIKVRSLGMKGKQEKNLEYFERFQAMKGQAAMGPLLPRIRKMDELFQMNAKQVSAYDSFLTTAWTFGKVGPDAAQEIMRQLLESPTLSQKLLSAFFYYNPQTGQTQLMMPAPAIGKFIDNIREMVSQPERDNEKAFKTIIEAFDQVNKERAHIVNNQGKVIADFADQISKFNIDSTDNNKQFQQIREYIMDLNNGDLFKAATSQQSFKQIRDGEAKTEDVKSVTGDSLGTNDLFDNLPSPVSDAKPGAGAPKENAFVLEKPKPPTPSSIQASRDTIGNIILPPGSNPPPPHDPTDKSDKDMGELWAEHEKKRREFIDSGHTKEDADAAGLKSYTFDEFKQNYRKLHPKSPEQIEKERESTQKRMASYRLAKTISTYHSQGKAANDDGFDFRGGTPSILQVRTDNLSQNLYMFSPEWQRMNSAVAINEDELILSVDKDNREVNERIQKAKQAEEAKKKEEEAQRRREQQILDYSAKVEGGFIEVKIGEDVDAMRQAWDMHERKRREFIDSGYTREDADKAGLLSYTWEDWKRYYRKMHGLPEDGIKRIPFEGKRKERQIDWSARYPMSPDELAQYGIEVSEDGPVMIPLDKAMKAAGSLLANAKTIYSVRDGLEIMRQGLKIETNRLKEQNKGGQPVAVAQVGGGEGGEATQPTPPDQSQYAEVG